LKGIKVHWKALKALKGIGLNALKCISMLCNDLNLHPLYQNINRACKMAKSVV
jgi:hypothetical protein